MIVDPLAARVTSAFPLSIATSLAFESIFDTDTPTYDPERVKPPKVNISDYQSFYINILTLIRNILGAVDKEHVHKIGAEAIKDCLLVEIDTIKSIIKNEGNGLVEVYFYVSDYKDLNPNNSPHVLLRMDNTDKQKASTALRNDAIKRLLKELGRKDNILLFSNDIRPVERNKGLILTHIAYDLLSSRHFVSLDLIESHTGILKKKHLWYTKFYNGKELSNIPFNKIFLKIFGDNEHFRPQSIKVRKDLMDLAIAKNWNQTTHLEKVKFDLGYLKDPYLKEVINSI